MYKIAFIGLFCISPFCNGQIQLDTTKSADYLVKKILLGKGVLVGEVTHKGPSFAIAHFQDSLETIGMDHGILLSTGNVYYALGPNRSPRTGWASNVSGDEDLDKITQGRTHDASVLEFDFIASSENLSFQFVFASEEYQEYVGSKFNDVFGFFLTGPNADRVNLAILPDGKTPITINNVNHQTGKDYYVDNPYINTLDPYVWDVKKKKVIRNKMYQKKGQLPEYDIQYDGFTVVLTARYVVIPNEIYRIKMAVADVADGILDSGVFLVGGTFQSEGEQEVTITRRFSRPEEIVAKEVIIEPLEKEQEVLVIQEDREHEEEIISEPIAVWFDFDSFDLTDSACQIIKNISELLSNDDYMLVEVVGHTDSRGSDSYNMGLSRRRSSAVTKHLIDLGVYRDRIMSDYRGEELPVSTNETPEGRAKNRRVEFVLKKQSASLR